MSAAARLELSLLHIEARRHEEQARRLFAAVSRRHGGASNAARDSAWANWSAARALEKSLLREVHGHSSGRVVVLMDAARSKRRAG